MVTTGGPRFAQANPGGEPSARRRPVQAVRAKTATKYIDASRSDAAEDTQFPRFGAVVALDSRDFPKVSLRAFRAGD